MMDLSDKVSDHDLLFNGGSGSESTSGKKICSDCKTSKTPLWRVGPNGPKTLCNACGIKYRKQRGTSLNKVGAEMKRKEKRNEKRNEMSWKLRFMDVGEEVFSKRSKSSNLDKQRKWGEVEQAAVLLMALSCGSVYC